MTRNALLASTALGMFLASPVIANDLTVSTPTTSALTTSAASNGSPGNITISSTGSVTTSAAGATVTLDSNNNLTNGGTISNTANGNATGVNIIAGNSGFFLNTGNISVLGSGTPPSSASQYGILLNGTGAFTGNIEAASGSNVLVAGTNANAIGILSELNGNLTLRGLVKATGTNSNAVQTTSAIDGAFLNYGTIQTVSGSASTLTINPSPGSPIAIGGNVSGGLLNAGPLNGSDTTPRATVSTVGTAPAIIIAPSIGGDVGNVSIGILTDTTNPGYSIINRGNITADGLQPGVSTIGLQIGEFAGNTGGKLTTLAGGLFNAGVISATATSDAANATHVNPSPANANAIIFGIGSSVPTLNNTGNITATAGGALGGNATAILIQSGASLASLTNSGIISASATTTNTAISALTAKAISDATGTLTSIQNSGTISATSSILGNNAQSTVAVDLSLATSPITFTNSGHVIGDILLGNATGSQLTISGAGASVSGTIRAVGNGRVDIAISQGGAGGALTTASLQRVGNLSVGAAGTLTLEVGSLTTVVNAGGPVTFDPASHILLTPASIISTSSITLIHSDTGLSFGNMTETLSTAQIPFLYTGNITSTANNLLLNLQLKSASQLGLTGGAAKIFQPVIAAAADDNPIGTQLGTLGNTSQVQSAMNQFLPFDPEILETLAASITDPNISAIGARRRQLLSGTDDSTGFNAWLDGVYDIGRDRGARSTSDGGVFGLDFNQRGTGGFGLAFSIVQSQIHENGARTSSADAQWYLVTPYIGLKDGGFFFDGQLDAGGASVRTRRTVSLGSINRVAIGNPSEMLASASLGGGYKFDVGSLRIGPQVGFQALELISGEYTEHGGGSGVDLSVSNHSQNLIRGTVGVSAEGGWDVYGGRLVPQVTAAWSQGFTSGRVTQETAFASSPTSTFSINGREVARSAAIGSAHLDYVRANTSIGLGYDASFGTGTSFQSASVRFSTRF